MPYAVRKGKLYYYSNAARSSSLPKGTSSRSCSRTLTQRFNYQTIQPDGGTLLHYGAVERWYHATKGWRAKQVMHMTQYVKPKEQ